MHTINCSALHIFVSHMDGKPNCRTCFPEPSRAKGMHNDGKTGSLTPVESIAWWPQCATTIGVNRALRAPRVAIGAVFAPDRWGTNETVFRDPLVTGRPFSRKTLVDCHARRAGFFPSETVSNAAAGHTSDQCRLPTRRLCHNAILSANVALSCRIVATSASEFQTPRTTLSVRLVSGNATTPSWIPFDTVPTRTTRSPGDIIKSWRQMNPRATKPLASSWGGEKRSEHQRSTGDSQQAVLNNCGPKNRAS